MVTGCILRVQVLGVKAQVRISTLSGRTAEDVPATTNIMVTACAYSVVTDDDSRFMVL